MIEVEGANKLVKKLERMNKKDSKAAVRKGSREGSKIVQKQAKANAPKKTGQLRKSIKVRSLPRSTKWVGTTVKATDPKAGPLEYGTKHIEPREFMQQAVDQQSRKAGDRFAEVTKEEIIKRSKT